MSTVLDYAVPGPFTTLDTISSAVLEPACVDPLAICFPVHGLFIQPSDAEPLGMPSERFATNQIRPAATLVAELLALDPSPLTVAREPDNRVVGTCRHFAVLSCALLRYRGIPARVRCGFATYFQPNQGLDHWITEYRDDNADRWVRIDSEILGQTVLTHPEDLAPGEFLTGSEAWTAFRKGEIDAATFGVYGSENWGAAEIRGNAVKQASLGPRRHLRRRPLPGPHRAHTPDHGHPAEHRDQPAPDDRLDQHRRWPTTPLPRSRTDPHMPTDLLTHDLSGTLRADGHACTLSRPFPRGAVDDARTHQPPWYASTVHRHDRAVRGISGSSQSTV